MQQQASVLIAILEDALHRVEINSKDRLNDPAVIEVISSLLRGITELEAVRSAPGHLRAA